MGWKDVKDRRSPEAVNYRRWYKTAAWLSARRAQLGRQPLCERHLARGEIVPATVVNHLKPHRGGWSLFADPRNHESSCKPCHDGPIQAQERSTNRAVDSNGWPTS